MRRRIALFVVASLWLNQGHATLPEIEKSCLAIYKKSHNLQRRKSLCTCIVQNIEQRFQKDQIEELSRIYKNKFARYEASKDERSKAYLAFDSEVHSQCLQDPRWRRPPEDLGRPDEL